MVVATWWCHAQSAVSTVRPSAKACGWGSSEPHPAAALFYLAYNSKEMIQILLHSSKTMRIPELARAPLGTPQLIDEAVQLVGALRGAPTDEIQRIMKVSPAKADEVKRMFDNWNATFSRQVPAIDAFIGDIYSGLQVQEWTDDDRRYAHKHLLILSGLYGALRACDGILPYRLEMGYKLPDGTNLYKFWEDKIAALLPGSTQTIINLSAVEYTKAILPYCDAPVVAPKFLTVSPKTGEPTFVTVHAKIARGAFARWLIQDRIEDTSRLPEFSDLGYRYDKDLSATSEPVFVCREFKGLGLSVRLT